MATSIRTTCTMDCPDSCALEVTVAEGKITRIQAASAETSGHPNTQGFICDKVGKFDRRVYHDSRLLYPQRRVGPKGEARFERICWDEAIAEIVAKFREIIAHWGAEAILPYHYDGSNGLLSHEFLDAYFFAKLGASRLARTLCAAPATAVAMGMYGKMPGVAFEDYPNARAIIVWGANPKVSNIHLVPYLRQAKKNGAFIAVVDPIRNFNPGEIDLHLPIYPGADLPVALALIRIWREGGRLDHAFLAQHADGLEPLLAAASAWSVERAAAAARVPASAIEELALAYAESSPAVIRVGWGIERNQNGGQALAAVLAMPALLGKFGVRGGGYTLSNSGAAKLDTAKLFGADSPQAKWATRELNMSQLGSLLMDGIAPPVKALFVYDCNPVATAPDQNAILRGLAREDLFTVVHEQVMTDTAHYADILLPAVTFLEQHEIKRSYGSYIVGGVQPVIEPCGETKPNEWVFAQLGRAMGFSDEPFGWDTAACMHKVVEALSLHGQPCDVTTLAAGGIQGYAFSGGGPVQFESVHPLTPDGKVHLTPTALGPTPFQYVPVSADRFPLALVSASNNKMISSTLGEFNYPELWLTLHPTDATARGIAEGDEVRVFNDLGEVRCRARLSDRMREGVCGLPKGAWRKSSRNGQSTTALCPQHVNAVAGGACFNDARVQVEKASPR
ncbi:MAG: molybdopterin-dependent oxidoreductase [Verrucomicrobia bacterium]|nr:molybdopterin-dependent oxidoreductase [Verrucomicrobiota bacterium]